MKQIKRADLHMHSTFSDGVEEPEELVVRAKKQRSRTDFADRP